MQNACMHAANFLMKLVEIGHLAYMYFDCFRCRAKVYSRCQSTIENVNDLELLLIQSLALKSCSYLFFPCGLAHLAIYSFLTSDSARVLINLITIISIVLRDKIVRLSVTCKII